MIKARVCVGDAAEGERFLASSNPSSGANISTTPPSRTSIRSSARSTRTPATATIAIAGHNIKLGRGGIREIEFFAQTQQLILGGRIPALRSPAHGRRAGGAHARAASSPKTRAATLTAAYEFLRTLEHRLQMIEDEQTHTLPKTREGLDNVARFMGFADTDEFAETLRGHLTRVQSPLRQALRKRAVAVGRVGQPRLHRRRRRSRDDRRRCASSDFSQPERRRRPPSAAGITAASARRAAKRRARS